PVEPRIRVPVPPAQPHFMTYHAEHVIFGTGAAGLATLDALLLRGERVRLVNRSGQAPVPDAVRSPPACRWRRMDHDPADKRTLFQQVVDDILDQINDGRLNPNDP